MKVEIPETLKTDIPQTTWGKILSATPVVMAVLATLLAALSTSEMTRAQYERSLAAQQQSKAGDQWSFFQAKRLRGSMQRSTLDLLAAMAPVRPMEVDRLLAAAPDAGKAVISALTSGRPLVTSGQMQCSAEISTALKMVETQRPETEIAAVLAQVKATELADALRSAQDNVRYLDDTIAPVSKELEQLEAQLMKTEATKSGEASFSRDFIAARLQYAAARYDIEARANQAVASLYELHVRKSNMAAQRHHTRSQRFFFGMLAAQAGVVIATFAMAARKRNFLWSVAASAGLIAVAFAIYVYLYV